MSSMAHSKTRIEGKGEESSADRKRTVTSPGEGKGGKKGKPPLRLEKKNPTLTFLKKGYNWRGDVCC